MKKIGLRRGGIGLILLLVAALVSGKEKSAPAGFEIREAEGGIPYLWEKNGIPVADGLPYLWENGIPYFTRFQETDHEILDLGGVWKFQADPGNLGVEEKWFAEVRDESGWKDHPIPGSWQAVFPELLEYLGAGWYRRSFTVPASLEGRFNRLVLDGAGFHTRVWLNGEEVGRHSGNYTRWSLDLSAQLRYGRENSIAIRVDNVLGFSDVPPRLWAGDRLGWWEYAGIQRLIQIESSPRQTLCKLAVTAEPLADGSGRLALAGLAYNYTRNYVEARLSVRLTDLAQNTILLFPAEEIIIPALGVAGFKLQGSVPQVAAWSPETPGNRYRLSLTLSGPEGQEKQALEIGFKKLEARGTGLYLNGKPYYIRGINRHEDDPKTGLYQTDDRMEQDISLLKELKVNHMRMGHYPNDPRWLDRMDREGFTICEEIPLYQAAMGFTKPFEAAFMGERELGKPPAGIEKKSVWALSRQQSDPQLIRNAIQQILEAIERDRNHPALVMWSVGNENLTLSFFPDSRAMHRQVIEAVRRFDPDRLVTFAVITSIANLSPRFEGVAGMADVISINQYYGWYYGEMSAVGPYLDRVHKKWPDKPILASEFGADAPFGRHAPAGAKPEKFTEEYQVQMLTHTWREIQKRDFMVGGMPWCFADFRVGWFGTMHPTFHMNEKGVLSYTREKKPGFEALKQIYQEIEARER